MAGGNGKKGDVIILRPEREKTMIDEMDVFDERARAIKDERPKRPKRFMGTLEEDSYIVTLAMQYRSFMERREIRLRNSRFFPGNLSFEDYLQIRGEM